MVAVNASSSLATFLCLAFVVTAIPPLRPAHPSRALDLSLTGHFSASTNTSQTQAVSVLPPDPSTFAIPNFPNIILMLHHFAQPLGVAGVDDAVLTTAILDAQAHAPTTTLTVPHTYVENHVQFRVVPAAKTTWGEWTAAARVVKAFMRQYEFVGVDFQVIGLNGDFFITGFVDEVLWWAGSEEAEESFT